MVKDSITIRPALVGAFLLRRFAAASQPDYLTDHGPAPRPRTMA
jgi:hypothetical protein